MGPGHCAIRQLFGACQKILVLGKPPKRQKRGSHILLALRQAFPPALELTPNPWCVNLALHNDIDVPRFFRIEHRLWVV